MQPMVDQCHSNWGRWKELAEERKQEKERIEKEKLEREQQKEEEEKLVGFFNFDISIHNILEKAKAAFSNYVDQLYYTLRIYQDTI